MKLAKEYHPDKAHGKEDVFISVVAAKTTICHRGKRILYDMVWNLMHRGSYKLDHMENVPKPAAGSGE